MKQKIISILNQKGGVGKTTTTINLGSYLAKEGKTVLIVDFDPQGNASSGLGIRLNQQAKSLADVLSDEVPAKKVIMPTKLKALNVIACDSRLASSEIDLAGVSQREFALQKHLKSLDYEYILIDCPPSLGLLTINALVASREVLIPVQAEYYALEGLSQLLQVMEKVSKTLNPDLELLGVLVTMYDKRTSLSGQVYREIKSHFGDKIFATVIPRNVKLAEAPSHGLPISEYDKWSKGARSYKKLAKELLEREAKHG